MRSIKLTPMQIPKFWDIIKFATTKVDGVLETDRPLYLNKLLNALLNDKAQCFVRLDDNRKLMAIAVTRISFDEITGEKALFVNCLYSFESVNGNQWSTDIGLILQFAKNIGCKRLITYSNNHRVFDIVSMIGFKERFRCFNMEL